MVLEYSSTLTEYTVLQLVQRVTSDLGLTDYYKITSGSVIDWLNEAVRIIARDTSFYVLTVGLETVAGSGSFPLPFDLTGRAIDILEVRYNGQLLTCASLDQMQAVHAEWRTTDTSGTPRYYAHQGNGIVHLHPKPDSSTGILTVTYSAIPPRVTNPQQVFRLPHGCEDAILSYSRYRSADRDISAEGRLRVRDAKAEWQEARREVANQVANVATNEITSMGSDMLFSNLRSRTAWDLFNDRSGRR